MRMPRLDVFLPKLISDTNKSDKRMNSPAALCYVQGHPA